MKLNKAYSFIPIIVDKLYAILPLDLRTNPRAVAGRREPKSMRLWAPDLRSIHRSNSSMISDYVSIKLGIKRSLQTSSDARKIPTRITD